ncbi:MAG: ribose-phosphate diphosphokinase [Candidatus Pacearchaeota archaeon]|jgi:ribose-phosphate pyrophosphokinase
MPRYKSSIIADPKSDSWDFATKIYNKLKERDGEFELNPVNVTKFRDGETKIQIRNNVRRRSCYFVHDSNKNPSDWFLQLCLVNETLKNSSAHEIIDVLPYLKFARQDRKDASRVPISAKVVADVIGLYANKVLTLEVHNPSIQGFYSIPFDGLYSFPEVIKHLKNDHPNLLEDIVIMSTDAGGAPRTKAFATRIGKDEIAVGYKSRKKAGEVSSLKILGDVNGKNVLIIDDMIDSGGTLATAAKSAREAGAKNISTYCTHGLFTEGIDKFKEFDLIMVGDAYINPIIKKDKRFEIVPFAPLFAEAIYRIQKGDSLSELFD